MGHETYERNDAITGSTNRAFGFVFTVVFAAIGAYPWLFGAAPRWWSFAVAALFLAASLLRPALLAPLNRLWTRFGALLHRIVSPIVLGFMFFAVITPMGWMRRLLVKDPLHLRFDRAGSSYWVARSPPGPPPDSLNNQF